MNTSSSAATGTASTPFSSMQTPSAQQQQQQQQQRQQDVEMDENDDWSQFEDVETCQEDVADDNDFENKGESDSSFQRQRQQQQQQQHQQQQASTIMEFNNLPRQLHPAVSLGARRVSSCYFSLQGSDHDTGSIVDLLSQWEDEVMSVENLQQQKQHPSMTTSTTTSPSASASNLPKHQVMTGTTDVLYHDILMNVFTYLDAPGLAAFSETAKRPNFEVFYFLQLQLQRSLLVHPLSSSAADIDNDDDWLASIAGSACLSRLARLRPSLAQEIVNEFSDSNATLKTMPLSHSLAYFRKFLQRHGLANTISFPKSSTLPTTTKHNLASGAALLATVVGAAATTMMTASGGDVSSISSSIMTESLTSNTLFFQVGGVVGTCSAALMATKTHRSHSTTTTTTTTTPSSQTKPMVQGSAYTTNEESSDHHQEQEQKPHETPTSSKQDGMETMDTPTEEEKEQDNKQVPSGPVGAYSRAIQKAATTITSIIKEERKQKFRALSEENQRELSLAFLDACSSDTSLGRVQEMVHTMDVDAFFVGSDGSETCALHTAAYHGAEEVIQFLCQGIDFDDEDGDTTVRGGDGGLCDVNLRDTNGWTALHFAAGANCLASIDALACCVVSANDGSGHHTNCQLDVQANNGYTPLQWAIRLSNEAAATRLKTLLQQQKARLANKHDHSNGWIYSGRPLTEIANRFFALIPTQS